jgi:hypothetical protein
VTSNGKLSTVAQMNKTCSLLAATLLTLLFTLVCVQDERRAPSHESTWQWLADVGLCTAAGHRGKMALMNSNLELEPDAALRTPSPFTEPSPTHPLYNLRAEHEVMTTGHVVRLFRRGNLCRLRTDCTSFST